MLNRRYMDAEMQIPHTLAHTLAHLLLLLIAKLQIHQMLSAFDDYKFKTKCD